MRIDLHRICAMKQRGEKIAMLTAYDYPTARLAAEAGVDMLLVGDSMGNVLLGHESTRDVPIDLIVVLAAAVRRGAPRTFVVGDMPFSAMKSVELAVATACRFRDESGCDAVKVEVAESDDSLIAALTSAGIHPIAHLGLRPQQVTSSEDYRAQARTHDDVLVLAQTAARMVDAGAVMILLEAVPNEASAAVVDAVDVPVIGCGAGSACDGHVVVTQDMLGLTFGRLPRFVPQMADLKNDVLRGMKRYVDAVRTSDYPAPEHGYAMRDDSRAGRESS